MTNDRQGIGLCLSGGGYRATLFHLGTVRRLHELGILERVRTIASVSGGSITAAHLAATYPWPAPGSAWEHAVAAPLREFTKQDIRTGSFLKSFLPGITTIDGLVPHYDRLLKSTKLSAIPAAPRFIFCATDMAFGSNFEFRKDAMGDYQLGYAAPGDWPLAKAVAASACFPPLFNPMKMDGIGPFSDGHAQVADPKKWANAVSDLRLTDGGNYDNIGTEPVWKSHEIVLVSDAGGIFAFESDRNLFWRIQRYQAIQEAQSRSLRKRWLIDMAITKQIVAAYWSVRSARSRYIADDHHGYSKNLATEFIATIRTDLDSFSDAESGILQNHGYLLADIAVRRHAMALVPQQPLPLKPPFPEWLPKEGSDGHLREALRESHKRKIFGRKS